MRRGFAGWARASGWDIKELMDRPLAEQKRGAELGQAVFSRLDRLRIPSVALVNGYAFGGGCELALACTFRLASPNARFGLPEIKLGLIPGYGGTQRLPRLIGEARALELIMTGRTANAEEALRLGLVNRIVEPPLLDAAFAFAREFSSHGLLALQFAREAVQRAASTTLAEGLRADPSRITRPSSLPQAVSTTRSASTPARNPGPRPIASGATPRMGAGRRCLWMRASTTTSGRMVSRTAGGPASVTGTAWPQSSIKARHSRSRARLATTPASSQRPSKNASVKAIPRRGCGGRGASLTTTRCPAWNSARATAEATSADPRTRIRAMARQ